MNEETQTSERVLEVDVIYKLSKIVGAGLDKKVLGLVMELIELGVNPESIADRTMKDVRELMNRFQNLIHGFAIVEAQFETIISFKKSVAEHVDLEELFAILDNDHDGRIDGLELLGGLALCCHASFEEKARFCFELFDFNLNSLLSQKELAMMMMSSICGMNVLTGGGEELEPTIDDIDSLAKDALLRADLNGDGQISYEEFIYWARSNRELMAGVETLSRISTLAKEEVESDDSAPLTDDDGGSVFGDDNNYTKEHISSFQDENTTAIAQKAATSATQQPQGRDKNQIRQQPGRGDQSLAIVPWLGQIHEPTTYKKRKGDDDGPATNLTLMWAFGVQAKRPSFARYLLHSDTGGKFIVYTTASLCVIYECATKLQDFYSGHSAEITALATNQSNLIVATADKTSTIHIWTLDAKKKPVSLFASKGLVTCGIQNLAFSPRGDRIATVAMDSDHTICIHNATSGELISSAKGLSSPQDAIDMAYSPSGNEVCLVGKFAVKFFVNVQSNARALDNKLGRIGNKGKRQVFCSVVYGKDEVIVGCASGEIYRFVNHECVAIVQAHGVREAVLCISYIPVTGNYITGGKDANIKTWDSTLKSIGLPIDLSEDANGDGQSDSGSLNPAVLSVQQLGDKILIGTKGCDIFEATLPPNPGQHANVDRIAWGHASGELWGLACHPTRDEFATVGDDKTVRIWSIRSHEQINLRAMPEAARAVAYNPAGSILCIGSIDGSVSLMESQSPTLRVYQTWQHASRMIHDIKFSNDGTMLAVSSADTNIYLYKSDDLKQFRRQAVCRGHSGAVQHIDFSSNNQYLQSNATDASILYWDLTGNQIKQSSSMKDTNWATFTCVFGWPVKGIWPSNNDYTSINACQALSDIGDIITGDDSAKVNLYRYPALTADAVHQSYVGHASHVTNVRFTWSKRQVVSIGGGDRSILLWRHDVEHYVSDGEHGGNGSDSNSTSAASSADSAKENQLDVSTRKLHPQVPPRSIEQEAANLGWSIKEMKEFASQRRLPSAPGVNTNKAGMSAATSPAAAAAAALLLTQGDQAGAQSNNHEVAPWRASVIEPTNWIPANGATDVDLTLQWIHGHRSKDIRNNVLYTAEGSLVYSAANVGVVYHKPTGKQQFLHGPHIDEIISIGMHPAGQIVATGEAGRKSNIIVWNTVTMGTLSRLESVHSVGTSLLSFNASGDTLASIGLDKNNTLCLTNWQKNIEILRTSTGRYPIFCCCFLPPYTAPAGTTDTVTEPSLLPPQQDVLVTGGHKNLKFWWWQGQNIQTQSAIWVDAKDEKSSIILCIGSLGSYGMCVTGSNKGNLLIWRNFKVACNTRQFITRLDPNTMDMTIDNSERVFYPVGGYPHRMGASILALWVILGTLDFAHETNDCMRGYSRSCRVISGDSEGIIAIWRLMELPSGVIRLVLVKKLNIMDLRPAVRGGRAVKSICERDGLLLIGNSSSEIVEVRDESIPFVFEAPPQIFLNATTPKMSATLPLPAKTPTSSSSALVARMEGKPITIPALSISSGHGTGEVWGLTTHPLLPVFFTSADDNTIRCWHQTEHRLLSFAYLGDKSRAIDIMPQGAEHLAIALNDGQILIVHTIAFLNPDGDSKTPLDPRLQARDVSSLLGIDASSSLAAFNNDSAVIDEEDEDKEEAVSEVKAPSLLPTSTAFGGGKDGKFIITRIQGNDYQPAQWVQVLKYCFNDSFLAAGAYDHVIYLYDSSAKGKYALVKKFTEHKGHITHLDFGVVLQVNTTRGEMSYKDGPQSTVCTTIGTDFYDPELMKITTVTVDHVVTTTASTASLSTASANASSHEEVPITTETKLVPPKYVEKTVQTQDIVVQSTSAAGDLFFWKIDLSSVDIIAKKTATISEVKDSYWHSFTCPYGWSVQGIWSDDQNNDSKSEILAVARSHSYDKVPVIAAADLYGRVRLFSYPVVQIGAPDKCYQGHTNKVTNIQFSFDDSYCFTTGGADLCIFVWATDVQDEIRQRAVYLSSGSGGVSSAASRNNNIGNINELRLVHPMLTQQKQAVSTHHDTDDDDDHHNNKQPGEAEEDELTIHKKMVPTAGDEFTAVKPWKGAIREPTDYKETPDIGTEPDVSLNLRFVYGYRGWDCRNNISFADSKQEIVYHIAGVGCVLNTSTNTQITNTEHDDDILSVAVHPEGHTVATGEIGKFPKIVLWDANTGVTLRTIMGHKKGVSQLSFSSDGKMLISMGLDEDRMVMVHNSTTGALLGKGKCGKGLDIYCLSVSAATGCDSFVTGGKNFVKFWTLPAVSSTGGELSSKAGIFSLKAVKVKTACSAAFLGQDGVTGMQDGCLLLWKDRSNTKCITAAHNGAITAMTAIRSITSGGGSSSTGGSSTAGGGGENDGARDPGMQFLITGGKDGFVHVWDVQFNKIWSMNLNETTPTSLCPQIQAVAAREGRLLVGTKAAEIYEVSLTGSLEAIRHVEGHFDTRTEVWGLATHPKLPQFVTCGDDMIVRRWDANLRRPMDCCNVGTKCRAAAYHPDGSQIAVALFDGHLIALSNEKGFPQIAKVTVCSSWSQCLSYSRDGSRLAVGTHDSFNYILETKSFSCLAKCKGHHSFITGVDFSDDGAVLRSTSGDYELLFWNVATGKQITSATSMRDIHWATVNTPLNWAVQGIWPAFSDGSDVNNLDLAPNGLYLATGDDDNLVKIFRYPACREHAKFRAYKGHSENVMNVRFSADGKWLYSVGGLDKAVLQFAVKYENPALQPSKKDFRIV